MKIARRTTLRRLQCVAVAFAVLVAIISACSTRNTTTANNVVGAVLFSERLQKLAGGGYCFAQDEEHRDACENGSLMQTANVFRYVPASVTVLNESLEPSAQGTGYEYFIEWSYAPSIELTGDEGGISGNVLEDPAASPLPVVSSWPAFAQNLRVLRTFGVGRPTSFRAAGLLPGRRYVYYLGGTFFGGRRADHLAVAAYAIYLRVVVDLTRSSPVDSR